MLTTTAVGWGYGEAVGPAISQGAVCLTRCGQLPMDCMSIRGGLSALNALQEHLLLVSFHVKEPSSLCWGLCRWELRQSLLWGCLLETLHKCSSEANWNAKLAHKALNFVGCDVSSLNIKCIPSWIMCQLAVHWTALNLTGTSDSPKLQLEQLVSSSSPLLLY